MRNRIKAVAGTLSRPPPRFVADAFLLDTSQIFVIPFIFVAIRELISWLHYEMPKAYIFMLMSSISVRWNCIEELATEK
jgi:hypothetical protein